MTDYDKLENWHKETGRTGYIHENHIVATFDYHKNSSVTPPYTYVHNIGELIPMLAYTNGKPTYEKLRGKILKAGDNYYDFDKIYEAIRDIRVLFTSSHHLDKIMIKEQFDKEGITAFCYGNEWFIIAPLAMVGTDPVLKDKILTPKTHGK